MTVTRNCCIALKGRHWQGKARQSRARQEGKPLARVGQDKAMQDRTRYCKARQAIGKAGWDKARQDRTRHW